MARNPFEQLRDVVVEPRQAFEDIATLILKCIYPDSRRVRVYRGDGGIDAFIGTLGAGGEADVFQVKYFPDPWESVQKQQIKDSYTTAHECADYELKTWTLCVPVRLTKEDLHWFDEWRGEQDTEIHLFDGDDLTRALNDQRSGAPRQKLREWGLTGIISDGPLFAAHACIHREDPKRGLTAVIQLFIKNDGVRTARGIVVRINHSETGCLAGSDFTGWEHMGSSLNPRTRRYPHPLNSTEGIALMEINLCERSTMPCVISLKITAEDMPPTMLECEITSEKIAAAQTVPFEPLTKPS